MAALGYSNGLLSFYDLRLPSLFKLCEHPFGQSIDRLYSSPSSKYLSSFCLYSLVLICVITSGVLLARTTLIAGILRRISSSNVWLSTLLVSLRTLLTCSCITTFLYALPRRCDLLALLRLQCSRVHCVP